MKIEKAVITAAGADQRMLPLQTMVDRDGQEKSVLSILIDEALGAGVEEVCVVVWPGDEDRYLQAAGKRAGRVTFLPQTGPRGYGAAIQTARQFTGDGAFLHLVGDHLYAGNGNTSCARGLLELARQEECTVSAVQVTREGSLTKFGTIGARRVPGRNDVYRVETVIEKPTPTEAEQKLMVSGLRAGTYLCFFGMHVFTPGVMDLLSFEVRSAMENGTKVALTPVLAELARREQYLALEESIRRYDIGERYGLLMAQFALALSGRDRDEVLTRVLELLASRELSAAAGIRQ